MDPNLISHLCEEAVATGVLPGVSVSVLGPEGVRFEGAFGSADSRREEALTPKSVFRLSSLTKSIVAVAAMQLVEQGRLDLDQSVGSILPAFDQLQVLEGFDGDVPRLRAPRTRATVAQLGTHTSGLAYDIWDRDILRYQDLTGAESSFVGNDAGLMLPLAFDPGTSWAYGTGSDWLAKVIEEITGRGIEEYLRAEILQPLGMTDTAYTLTPELSSRLVSVHHRAPGGGFESADFDWPAADRVPSGHGLYSTVADYGLFLRALLNGGELNGQRILSIDALKSMIEERIGGVNVLPMESTMPHLSHRAEFFPGVVKKQSFGFQTMPASQPGMRAAGTQSWAGLFNLFYWWDPENEVAAVFAAQMLPFQDPRVMELFVAFERAVYATDGARA